MTGIAVCCARTASGNATAEPAIPLMKSRRLIVAPRKIKAQNRSLNVFAGLQYKKIINTGLGRSQCKTFDSFVTGGGFGPQGQRRTCRYSFDACIGALPHAE